MRNLGEFVSASSGVGNYAGLKKVTGPGPRFFAARDRAIGNWGEFVSVASRIANMHATSVRLGALDF
jgi:hypothetical protein